MAAWPTTLPDPLASGYALKPVDMSIRTDMEMGAARTRRRTLVRNDKLSVGWSMTEAQLAAFRTWFEDAAQAAGGASWFSVTLNIGTGGQVAVEARFVGPWQASKTVDHGGLRWQVTAELEVR